METQKDDAVQSTNEPPLEAAAGDDIGDESENLEEESELERPQLGESGDSRLAEGGREDVALEEEVSQVASDCREHGSGSGAEELRPLVEEVESVSVSTGTGNLRGEDAVYEGSDEVEPSLAPESRLGAGELQPPEVVSTMMSQSSEAEGLIGGVETEVLEPLLVDVGLQLVLVEGEESRETVNSCNSPIRPEHVAFFNESKDEDLIGGDVSCAMGETIEMKSEELTLKENDVVDALDMVEEMLVPDVTNGAGMAQDNDLHNGGSSLMLEPKTEEVIEENENQVSSVVENMAVHEEEEDMDVKPVVPVIGGDADAENVAEEVEVSNEVVVKLEETNDENEVSAVDVERNVDEELESEEANVAEGIQPVKEELHDVIDVAVEMQVGEGDTSMGSGEGEMVMMDSEMATMEEGANEMEQTEEDIADVPEEADKEEASETEVAEEDDEMEEQSDKDESDMVQHDMADVADETDIAVEETDIAVEETEAAEETEIEEVSTSAGGKRKRAKSSKPPAKAPVKRKAEEDVCFICFDGGDLVLCDRRGCPKAYHPACVNRDEAFFRSKGKWNCGWHQCNNCAKNANYTCYTCTFSLCKACTKKTVILCVRGNKGFCETCMRTVMMIENNEEGNSEMAKANFDKSSWEYLFKDYWIDLKARLSLTKEEIAQAKNPFKGSDSHTDKQETPDELYDANNDGGSGSDGSDGNAETPVRKRRKSKRVLKSRAYTRSVATLADGNAEWASQELLEFVMHMKKGDKSVLSQFDVQALLLEYIKKNKLRDPRRKSQIVCDSRLQNLFGKPRVGHFEMLKLLESHFLLKEEPQTDDHQGSVVDTAANQLEGDGSSDVLNKASKDKRRKTRKRGDGRELQSNIDDYAAIDKHNINLVYLKRNLVEDLLEDTDSFLDRVVGAFVRIRISGNVQKQDLYRLVQVVGTSKAGEPYKVGKKTTDLLLEILNLNKTEVVAIDIISNQEFTDDECKRLRQSIKCGLINRLTVGDIQEKAIGLQAARVKDWLETETARLSHLRDRASDLGRRKELRECVEKLQLLKSPEERHRRLEEIPEIHADPNMNPSCESDEDEGEAEDKKQENYLRPRGSNFNRKVREPISPHKGGFASNNLWAGTRSYSGTNSEFNRKTFNKGFSNKGDDYAGAGDIGNENLWNQGRDKDMQHSMVMSQSSSKASQEISPCAVATNLAPQINESEKIWHYKDPSGKIQGPFSIVQLRKWSSTGYFPTDLKIWKTNENQDDSFLLNDALAGKFHKDPSLAKNVATNAQTVHSVGEIQKSQAEVAGSLGKPSSLSSLEVPKVSTERWGSETNLPSPTPHQNTARGATGEAFENQWSPTPAQSGGPLSGGNKGMQHMHMSSPTPKVEIGMAPEKHSQVTASDVNAAAMNLGVDPKNVGAILQNLVQSTNRPIETQAWGSGSVSKPGMSQLPGNGSQTASGHWANAPPPPTLAWNAGNSSGAFSGQVLTEPWRPQGQPQSNIRPPTPTSSNIPWGMGSTDNQGTGLRPPNIGPVPGNTYPNWVPPGQPQITENPNPGWAPPQGPGNTMTNTGWAPPQGPGPRNVNPNWSQVGGGLGPQPGNTNQNWGTPPVKHGMWRNNNNNQNHNGDRYSGQRERSSSHGGGDSGYRRQSSFGGGGGGSRPLFKGQGQKVCIYYENGHCKKGSACDYLHS